MNDKTKIILAAGIVVCAALSRIVQNDLGILPNFTPVAAMAIFAGCYLKKYWAMVLPLGAMLLADYFIGFYGWQMMLSVYVGMGLAFLAGKFLARRKKWPGAVFASLTSSVLFFLITNFAVWAFSGWYSLTWAGLINCYTLALPFFRNTVFGDLTYTVALFGLYEAIIWSAQRLMIKKQIPA